jgi:hypothetical protein
VVDGIVIAGAMGMAQEALSGLTDLGESQRVVGFVADPDIPEGRLSWACPSGRT